MFENFDAMMGKVLAIFPDAYANEGAGGEIIIHTNMVPSGGDGDPIVSID